MSNEPIRFGAFFVGGLLLSVWLYVSFLGNPFGGPVEWVRWNLYGLLGLLIAAGVYAARASPPMWRIAIVTGLGIVVGILFLAGISQEDGEVLAAAFTLAGGAIIVSALPPGSFASSGWRGDGEHATKEGRTQ